MNVPYKFEPEAHVHTYDGQPLVGTSTLIKEVMPPFLAKWGGQCAVDYIREQTKIETKDGIIVTVEYLEIEGVLEKAVNAWTKVRNKAATKGTDMHKELEDYVQHCIDSAEGVPQFLGDHEGAVEKFAKWACDNVQRFVFSEKNTFSKALWVGGVVDCLAILKGGQMAVIDFKSGKDAYFSAIAQVAGYALQLEESGYGNPDGSDWHILPEPISALIVVPFGAKTFKPTRVDNVSGFKEVFGHLVSVYSFLQAFNKRDK